VEDGIERAPAHSRSASVLLHPASMETACQSIGNKTCSSSIPPDSDPICLKFMNTVG